MIKVISTAALIAGMASASFAGALNDAAIESDVATVFEPVGSSSAGLALPLAIAGGVVAVGLLLSDSDDDTAATTTGSAD